MSKNSNEEREELETDSLATKSSTGRIRSTIETAKGWGNITGSTPFKILTGSAVGRTIGVVTTLAAATVATIPAVVVGLTSITVGVVMDTVQTGNLRYSKKEHSLLIKNRNAKAKQDFILNLEPKVTNALKNALYHPNRDNQTSLTERYDEPKTSRANPSSWGKAVLKTSIDTVKAATKVVTSRDVLSTAQLALKFKSFYGEGSKQLTKKELVMLSKKE